MGRLEAGVGEMERELRLDCFVVGLLEGSSTEDEGAKESERRPVCGLGVREGEGRLGAMVIRFPGVRDSGRRFKLDGRGFEGLAFVTARASPGMIGRLGRGTFSLIELKGRETSTESSSSSSSSTRVWSWSLAEEEEAPRSLNESRLFPINELPYVEAEPD
jgi:hypothetical protein